MEIDDLTALNSHEAAKFLGVEPGTLAVWRTRNYGPRCSYSGTRVVYYLPELRRFQDQCRARRSVQVWTRGRKKTNDVRPVGGSLEPQDADNAGKKTQGAQTGG